MKFRVFVEGDPHVKISNSLDIELMTASVRKRLTEVEYDFSVILGDVLDRFESIHVAPLGRAVDHIDTICKLSKHTFLLIGNHDRPNNNIFLTSEHPFTAMRHWPNLTIVDSVIVREMTSLTGVKGTFVFTPYVYPGRFKEALLTRELDYPTKEAIHDEKMYEKLKSCVAVFAHQEFYGAKMGIKTSVEGDTWPLEAPMCISGHIHDYQRLQDNLYYVGTPIQHGTTDIGEKTVSDFIFVLKDNNWHTEEERIDLKIPKKIHIIISKEEILKFPFPENASFVRLDIEIDPIEFRKLLKEEHIKKLKTAGVQIKSINPRKRIEKTEVSKKNFKVSYCKRLFKTIKDEDSNVQKVFKELFGTIKENKKKVQIRIKDN